MSEWVNEISISGRREYQLQYAADSVVAAEAAFVERRARDGLPIIALVARLGLRQTGQSRGVLPVVPAELVKDQIERRRHQEGESAGPGLPKCVPRRAGDVAVRVLFEHQGVRTVRIVRGHFIAQRNVI